RRCATRKTFATAFSATSIPPRGELLKTTARRRMRRAIAQSTQTGEVSPSRGSPSLDRTRRLRRAPGRPRASPSRHAPWPRIRADAKPLRSPRCGLPRLRSPLSRAGGKLVCLDGEFLRKRSAAQNLEPVGPTLDQAPFPEQRFIDHRARIQSLEIDQVDDRVFDPVGRAKAEFRQAALQRHLPALETFEVHVAGPRFLSLAAAAGGLSAAGALSSPHPLLAMTGPCGSAQLKQIHRHHLTLSHFLPPALGELRRAAGSSAACAVGGGAVPRRPPLVAPSGAL